MARLEASILAFLALSTAHAVAEDAPYFRVLPGPALTKPPSFVEQPAPAAYLAGGTIEPRPVSLRNAVPPVTHALLTPEGEITASLPQVCPGLAFSQESGSVTGQPSGSCDIPVARVASTDATGSRTVSEPFSITVAAPVLTLQAPSATAVEGSTVVIRPETNIPSPIWSVAGAPPGSEPSFSPDGSLRVYAPDVTAAGTYPLVLTATGQGVSRSVTFDLGISPVAGAVLQTLPVAVHGGGAFRLDVSTAATFPGTWQATGGIPLTFASPGASSSQATGIAPVNGGSASQAYQVDLAYVAANAPSGAVPAMAAGMGILRVHPALAIVGVSPTYSIPEGQAFALTPNAAPGSLIGAPTWSQSGLPTGLSLDSGTGKVTGAPAGGTASGGAKTVTLTLRDAGDPSSLGLATASFQITPSPAPVLVASNASLLLPAQALPAATGSCAALTVTNNGSLAASGLAMSVDTGAATFKACTPDGASPPVCTGSLAVGASCRYGLQMASTTTGTFSGSASVRGSNFSALSVQLSGSTSAPTGTAADTCYTTVFRNGYAQLAFSKPIYANGYYYSASWGADPLLNGTYVTVFGIERTSTGAEGYRYPAVNWHVPRNTPGSKSGNVSDPYTSQIQYFNMAASLPQGGNIVGYPTYNGSSKGPC